MKPAALSPDLEQWLRAFAAAVRTHDYDTAAGRLVDADVLSFGTVAGRVVGVDALVRDQWKVIWEATADFDFDYAAGRADVWGHRAWVAILWSSRGSDGGRATKRAGRATFVLVRHPDGGGGHDGDGWRAVHTHFSLMPEGSA